MSRSADQRRVLVINAGSSSIKYQLLGMPQGALLAGGQLEGIGADARLHHQGGDRAPVVTAITAPDHDAATRVVFDRLQADGLLDGPGKPHAVGHRVVHGGPDHSAPLPIDDTVIAQLDALRALAPLHNGPNLSAIHAARRHLPEVPNVAVFDTAFHHHLPPVARHYALPWALQQAHGIRRYGFHGLSHQYVAQVAADHLGRPLQALKLISLHLGNGASACAIDGGRSIDTSMGFTPLEGLAMGTRSGDLDPALPDHLADRLDLSSAAVVTLLNRDSGLRGLCGDHDMRRIEQRRAAGDPQATLAFELFCYRIRKYVGAYFAALGGAHVLLFTAGIGEHSAAVRAAVCEPLRALGIELDESRNAADSSGIRTISPAGATVAVLVAPTNEARQIASATLDCLNTDNVVQP